MFHDNDFKPVNVTSCTQLDGNNYQVRLQQGKHEAVVTVLPFEFSDGTNVQSALSDCSLKK